MPDDTTLVRFRDRLRRHNLMEKLERFFRDELSRRGLAVRPGAITIIDASLVPAATNPPQEEGQDANNNSSVRPPEKRDREAGFAKREKATVYGYKLHIALDGASGVVTAFEVTPANVHDTNVFESLLTGEESAALADKAYESKERRAWLGQQEIGDGIMYRGKRGAPLAAWQRELNRMIGRMRARVETTFAILKRWRGCGRARFLGLERVREQMMWGITAHNLLTAIKWREKCAQ